MEVKEEGILDFKALTMTRSTFKQLRSLKSSEGVEISAGGLDYTNPDALVAKYSGEFETYDDPREAVAAAIAICKAWRKDAPRARVGIGATLGMTMPFEPCSFAAARLWAAKMLEAMPKCDRCGSLLPRPHYVHPELDDQRFCSEYCAEEAA